MSIGTPSRPGPSIVGKLSGTDGAWSGACGWAGLPWEGVGLFPGSPLRSSRTAALFLQCSSVNLPTGSWCVIKALTLALGTGKDT